MVNSCWLFTQQIKYENHLISTEEKPTANLITALHKDQNGFIWMGSQYDLSRYDGYNLKKYDKQDFDFQDKTFRNIISDSDRNLWLQYNNLLDAAKHPQLEGVDIFNPTKGEVWTLDEFFKGKLPFKTSELTYLKIRDVQKRIWLTTNEGQLFLYQNGHFRKIFERKKAQIQFLTTGEDGKIWLGLKDKILGIDQSGTVTDSIKITARLRGVWLGENGKIWYALLDDEQTSVFAYDAIESQIQPFQFTKKGQPIFPKSFFIERDERGFWWLGSNNHIQVFNPSGNWVEVMDKAFEGEFLNGFIEDADNVWLSTINGLVKINFTKNPFTIIRNNAVKNHFRGITEDEAGNIYFLNDRLYKWNKQTEEVEEILKDGFYTLLSDDQNIWLENSNPDELAVYVNLKTGDKISCPRRNAWVVFHILKTPNPDRFLAATDIGLEYLDLNKQQVLPFFNPPKTAADSLLDRSPVSFLHSNERGIWAATNSGIFLVKENESVLRHFSKLKGDLPIDYIQHIYEDADGIFWLATAGGGLVRWQPALNPTEKSSFRQFTEADGLSNNVIYAVYEDDFGRLWLPSNAGLICMDKNTFQTTTFTTDDGLPHKEFNFTSHFKGRDGTLYFGGLGGIIAFHPEQMKDLFEYQGQLVSTGYYVLEEEAEELTDKTQLLQNTEQIVIHPTDKLHELEFVLLDYNDPKQHRYAYQIEGYSDHWHQIKENYVRITNLPYGKYTLHIKGHHSSSGWTAQQLSFPIVVVKPFYLQWWFLTLLILGAFAIIFATLKWRVRQLEADRKKLEAEVEKRTKTIADQAEALKELDKAKTNFFSNITHEFRTPLTLIIGPSEQLLKDKATRPFHSKISGIAKNARHLLSLINQLLDLSKLEHGQMKLETTYGDVIEFSKDLLNRFQPFAKSKNQELIFHSEQAIWETYFDKDKLEKILYNLLSNALKFTAKKGVIQLKINSQNIDNQNFIKIIVSDTGAGISKENLTKIFNRFYQTDSSSTRAQGGTGIGLALVKELVDMQNGTIQVESQEGEGTTFTLLLPVVENESLAKEIQSKSDKIWQDLTPTEQFTDTTALPPTNGTSSEKLELLIIEDNSEMRSYIRQCLDESIYKITEAKDGEEGIEAACRIVPDLIISDVMMPKKNGFEVVETIRKEVSTSHIPLVLLTAKASLESRLEGLQRGADAYLTKPFSAEELKLRVQKLIEIRQLLQSRYAKTNGVPTPETGKNQFRQEDEFIVKLRTFIQSNIENTEINVDFLANHFSISRIQLHRKLKALTNQSPSEFIRIIRLEYALQLIQKGNLNISEIAYQSGFSYLSHFSKIFKKQYGKSPSEMLKNK